MCAVGARGAGVGEGPGSRLAGFLVEPVRESLPRPRPRWERVLQTGLLLGGGEREPAPVGASRERQEGVSAPGGRWARTGDPELVGSQEGRELQARFGSRGPARD